MTTQVFFDFLCPYAWRGLEMAAMLREQGEQFQLRHYSLVEGNHPDNAEELRWRITEQPLEESSSAKHLKHLQPSLRAFLAAQAAARQGEEVAWRFTLALDRAHHAEHKELTEDTFLEAARQAGLNLAQFAQDRADETGLRARLRADLDEAHEIGVFGTPTFVLATGEAAYFRFEHFTRDPQQAQQLWALYQGVLRNDAGISTVKRAKNRPA